MKKLLMFLLLGMFFVSFASSMEIDNWVNYEDNDMKIRIVNAFNLGEEIGTAELKSHKSVNEVLHVAPGEKRVVMYYDFNFKNKYEDGLGKVYFTNMTDGEIIEKDYHFVIWDTIIEEKNNYSQVCNEVYNANNNSYSTICERVLEGTYLEEKDGWVELDVNDIPKGKVRIGLSTNVNLGETIDGVWTIAGKKIKKHAEWTTDLNVGLIAYYKFDEQDVSGSGIIIDSREIYNGTNNGTVNITGKINTTYDYNGSVEIVVDSSTGIDSVIDGSSTFSVSGWFNLDVVTNDDGLFTLRASSNGDIFYNIRPGGATMEAVIKLSSGFAVQSMTNPFTGEVGNWVFMTTTYDDSDDIMRTYKNGVSIDNFTTSGGTLDITAGADFIFGRYASSNYMEGIIDEVGLWDRSLSVSEVVQLYNGGSGISWTDEFGPTITLNSPEENFVTENQTIIFNTTINTTNIDVVNVSLLIDGVINETNTSGVLGDYIFQKDLSFGNHNWSIQVVDNETNTTSSATRSLSILDGSISAIWTDEYQVRIIASNLTESDFEINNLVITQEGDNLWKINTTEGDYEVARAQVMKTFFYGTDGSDPRINRTTELLKIQSVLPKDANKRGHYVTSSDSSVADTTVTYTGTFSDTSTNLDCSSWSHVQGSASGGGGGAEVNEIGTDTSTDENDNPSNSQIFHFDTNPPDTTIRWAIPTATPRNSINFAGSGGSSNSSSEVIIFCNGNITWVNSGFETTTNIDFTINESIPETSPIPNITLNSIEDNIQELPNTDISFNITSTITGSTLDEIKFFVNGTLNETQSISGTENTTIFIKSFPNLGTYNWSVEVCDISDNCALSETRDFEITVLTIINQTFNNVTTEGATEEFSISFTKISSVQVSTVDLIYNETINSFPYSVSGNNITSRSSITIPVVSSDTNVSFNWNITLTDGSSIITSSNNQTILVINADNCSTFTNIIYNFTQYDEENQSILSSGNIIELQINLYDTKKTSLLVEFSNEFIGVNPVQFCVEDSILPTVNYSSYVIVKYSANSSVTNQTHSIEYYNILNQTIGNTTIPINIALYNLKVDDTTKFRLTFRDGEFVLAPNILVQVHRQYIKDNDFKIVEIPLTDSNGHTVLNLVKNTVIYNFIMTNELNEIVGTFNSIAAFCSDFSIGDCNINLAPDSLSENIYDYDEEFDISFSSLSYNNLTKKISMSFVTGDLTAKNVRMDVVRNNDFGNRSVCSARLFSASGVLSCDVSAITDTDQFLFVSTFVEGELAKEDTTNLNSDILNFGTLNGAFYAFLFILFIITMFMEDRKILVISLGLGWVGVISLGLVNGKFIGFTSAGIWIIISIAIFLWKLNSEESL